MSTRFLPRRRADRSAEPPAAVALQQSVQVIVHLVLLIPFSATGSTSAAYLISSRYTVLYLIAGVARHCRTIPLRAKAATLFATDGHEPKLRSSRPHCVGPGPKRLVIVLGCAGTTLRYVGFNGPVSGSLWRGTTLNAVMVTMVGWHPRLGRPHPRRGWRSGRLIGGLTRFGVPRHWVCGRCCCIDY